MLTVAYGSTLTGRQPLTDTVTDVDVVGANCVHGVDNGTLLAMQRHLRDPDLNAGRQRGPQSG